MHRDNEHDKFQQVQRAQTTIMIPHCTVKQQKHPGEPQQTHTGQMSPTCDKLLRC